MDEDLIALCVMMALFIAFPLSIVALITGSIAYSRTKKWDKERTLKAANEETNTLLKDDIENDFVDTEDEAEHNERKAEEENDKFLTFYQKFRKEFKKVWNGKGAKQVIKEKEREERRKLAKAVARELDRRERRRARQAAREASAVDAPPYVKN